MKLDHLIGKIVVRKKPGLNGDSSYCVSPIKVIKITSGIVYCINSPQGKIKILDPNFVDAEWVEIDKIFVNKSLFARVNFSLSHVLCDDSSYRACAHAVVRFC